MKLNSVFPLLFLGVAGHASMALAQSPNTFTATGDMSTPRTGHTATLLTNGKVLIAGGSGTPYFTLPPLASAELYDPTSGTFTATGSMATSRIGHTATLLPNGKVLIAGGAREPRSDSYYLPVASDAELYDPTTGTFADIGNLDDGNYRQYNGNYLPSTTLLADGRVLIVGANAHLYDPVTGGLSDPIFDNYLGIYISQKGTLLMDGKVLFAGSDDSEGDYWGPELFDPSGEMFTATGIMTARRADHTATLLPDGTVLIAGRGWAWSSCGPSCFAESPYSTVNSGELYDPVTGAFSNTGNMATDREAHTATLLNDGTVLIAGGRHIGQPPPTVVTVALSSAEIYHPRVPVPAPLLFSLSGDGKDQGAILHAGTHQLVSAGNPAIAGEALEIYGTGLVDRSVIPPQVAIGGRMAEVLFFGKAPGFVGLNQINVRVPSGVVPGTNVPVRLTYLSRPSNEVTIGLR